jgi:hypothetical protein
MTQKNYRLIRNQQNARALRDVAKWLRTVSGSYVYVTEPVIYAGSQDEAHDLMRRYPGGWSKKRWDNVITYRKAFSEDISLNVHVYLTDCERVQVGVTHVPAVEAHDEPEYEWRCPDAS